MIDYLEVKDYFRGDRYNDQKSRRYYSIFCNIEKFINTDDIKLFYPKNLFLNDKELEVYIFLDGKILRARPLEVNNIELKILYLKDLIDFTCECIYDGEEYYYKLVLKFTTDELVFNKNEDTINGWGYKFEEQIKNITKILINDNIRFWGQDFGKILGTDLLVAK